MGYAEAPLIYNLRLTWGTRPGQTPRLTVEESPRLTVRDEAGRRVYIGPVSTQEAFAARRLLRRGWSDYHICRLFGWGPVVLTRVKDELAAEGRL